MRSNAHAHHLNSRWVKIPPSREDPGHLCRALTEFEYEPTCYAFYNPCGKEGGRQGGGGAKGRAKVSWGGVGKGGRGRGGEVGEGGSGGSNNFRILTSNGGIVHAAFS